MNVVGIIKFVFILCLINRVYPRMFTCHLYFIFLFLFSSLASDVYDALNYIFSTHSLTLPVDKLLLYLTFSVDEIQLISSNQSLLKNRIIDCCLIKLVKILHLFYRNFRLIERYNNLKKNIFLNKESLLDLQGKISWMVSINNENLINLGEYRYDRHEIL